MRPDNFIGFSIVSGFFLGLIFGFLAFEQVELVIIFAMIITSVCYLISVSAISVFNLFIDFRTREFNKQQLENNLEYYVEQFGKKEEELVKVLDYIKKIELNKEGQKA
ncbi:hypothetical protein CQA62_04680 [Helicobacter cholecystus]|uniref:Uncharacterized protein n=1 Tax=Helicobacter cholecystus TaxID=45498 RepID=A0A3D8IVA4_9HELI|nr:hypothetical protein [Helicobacter cholecystus]RDU68906.1 hypothetical protein CQA62_04680 [Helicobacter cholecystus]VEJ25865.1 Motility integral membrane protein [Helicobacter cholecystus]